MVATPEAIRPLRRVEYDRMVALGMFEDERIELLEGQLVPKNPIGPPHASTVQRLSRLLVLTFEGRAAVRCQSSFAALEFSEPEPDFAVVPSGDYDDDHPATAHLMIEVAESSLAKDRGIKLRLYASCGVPEYWIVNLQDRCIEVYTEPSVAERAYAHSERYEPGQSIQVSGFPDISLAVSDVLR
jgi:Uma2 family endonuclease